MLGRVLKASAALLVSGVFLFLLAGRVAEAGWGRVAASLASIDAPAFLGGVGLLVLSAYLQGWRWVVILRPLGEFQAFDAFASVAVGHWFNVLLPARLGELARPYHFARRHGSSFATMLAVTVVERFWDVLAMMVLAAVCLPTLLAGASGGYVAGSAVLYVLALLLVLGFAAGRERVQGLARRLPAGGLRDALGRFAADFSAGILLVRGARQAAGVFLATAAVWAVNVAACWLLLRSCRLPEPLSSLAAGATVAFAVTVGHCFPAAGAGLGVVNYGVLVALERHGQAAGLPPSVHLQAMLTASVAVYIGLLLPDVACGGCFAWRDRRLLLGFGEKGPTA
ncbi:MAG: flippase-like domain-containing protein [Elusimicrobia bacterium]|nr:flippase-like domain-containing protein [Elusimicrobiota bacterium]